LCFIKPSIDTKQGAIRSTLGFLVAQYIVNICIILFKALTNIFILLIFLEIDKKMEIEWLDSLNKLAKNEEIEEVSSGI
jgi:hypothetical protein